MRIIIIGGAGFIGCNAARFFLDRGNSVLVIDNLSRKGSKKNLEWLSQGKDKPRVLVEDIRNFKSLFAYKKDFNQADVVLHLAGQVAVTTSIVNPREDFEINALGTLNILECIRLSKSKAKLIYASTNKVYGNLSSEKIKEEKTRYAFQKLQAGVGENQKIDFHSPYGCSKGSADLYVHDYSRIYGLDTVVFRQSCIYGPRQFGVEDQGWVAWFMISQILNKPITIYGNGKQVRDILFIDDLLEAFQQAVSHSKKTFGQIYNIGGGPKNTISVWQEFKSIMEKLFSKPIRVTYVTWRPGDQPIYVSDIRKAQADFNWQPKVDVNTGIARLHEWIHLHKHLFN